MNTVFRPAQCRATVAETVLADVLTVALLVHECCVLLSPSVVCTECIVAKPCVLEQKLQLKAYRKSYMRNRFVPK